MIINFYSPGLTKVIADNLRLDDQEATIRAINKVMPAVVSIVITEQRGTVIVNLNS